MLTREQRRPSWARGGSDAAVGGWLTHLVVGRRGVGHHSGLQFEPALAGADEPQERGCIVARQGTASGPDGWAARSERTVQKGSALRPLLRLH